MFLRLNILIAAVAEYFRLCSLFIKLKRLKTVATQVGRHVVSIISAVMLTALNANISMLMLLL